MSVVDSYTYPINGKITRIVASNNLTVALKNYDGNDFSAGGPLVHKIGATPYSLTGALSVTVNAGTNTFNLGAAELKALRQDLFVYLGYRASNTSLFILLSRIPHARTYADFSGTATNEKYGAYSGAAPAGTDVVENIGRVSVQNSGSASYNWNVPTADVIINGPIYETDWLTWAPQPTYSGGTTDPTSNTVNYARYKIGMNMQSIYLGATIVRGTGDRTFTLYSLPMSRINTNHINFASSNNFNSGGEQFGTAYSDQLANIIFPVVMNQNGSAYASGDMEL